MQAFISEESVSEESVSEESQKGAKAASTASPQQKEEHRVPQQEQTPQQEQQQASSQEAGFKSGFVTLVGRPNAGKSTLLNAVMGTKLAITSKTAQTTRHRFRAVLTREDFQLILVDTPGIHKPHDALGEELNTTALKALGDVDVVAMLIDSSMPVGKGDRWVVDHLSKTNARKILVLSKSDLVDADKMGRQREAAEELAAWDDVLVVSALEGEGIEAFLQAVVLGLPVGPLWFPRDMQTDQSLEVTVAEFVREKILRGFRDEIPHAIGVSCDELDYQRKKDLYRIAVSIYVERESQKGMIIGKGGSALKSIGTRARKDLEHLLSSKVYLELSVKVRKNWRRDPGQVRRFGYGEGA